MTAWENRQHNRARWKQLLDEFRAEDASKLVRLSLEKGDIVSGIRDASELMAAREQALLQCVLWVQRDVPPDPTVTFTADDCDWVIRNDSDIDTFRQRLAYWAGAVGLPIRPTKGELALDRQCVFPTARSAR
jgi:hypothetical protein